MERKLKIGSKYKHFKNKLYLPTLLYDGSIVEDNVDHSKYIKLGQAINANNDESVTILSPSWKEESFNHIILLDKNNNIVKGQYVLYKALYSPYGIYIREYNNFMSEVDRIKYPKATQKYRFELIE